MKIKNLLTQLGLSKNESSIYLTLLSEGPVSISEMAKKTGLHRASIYKVLPNLEEKNLVIAHLHKKRKLYVAESPEKLKTLLTELHNCLDEELPELNRLYENYHNRPKVKFLHGKHGMSFVFRDMMSTLKKGDIYYRYRPAKNVENEDKYIPKDYRDWRNKLKLERFWNTNDHTKKITRPHLERIIKTVSEKDELFDYNLNQVIYKNKVAFIDYNSETALIIENEMIAKFQERLFKLLYSKL